MKIKMSTERGDRISKGSVEIISSKDSNKKHEFQTYKDEVIDLIEELMGEMAEEFEEEDNDS